MWAVAVRSLDEATVALLCQRPDREVRPALRELRAQWLPSERAELHFRVADTMVFASAEAAQHWQWAIALSADAPIGQLVEGMTLAELYGAAEDALALSGGSNEAVRSLADEALQRLADVDSASRADVLARAGGKQAWSAPQQALQLLHQALALYQRFPPSPGHVKALRAIYGILYNAGRLAEAADVIAQAAAVAERASQRTAQIEILGLQAWYQMAVGAGELAADRMRALRERLTDRDEPRLHLFLAAVHTDVLLKLGRLTEVRAAGAPALQTATAYGIELSPWAAAVAHECVSGPYGARGDRHCRRMDRASVRRKAGPRHSRHLRSARCSGDALRQP